MRKQIDQPQNGCCHLVDLIEIFLITLIYCFVVYCVCVLSPGPTWYISYSYGTI